MMTIDDMVSQVAKITGKALNDRPATKTAETVETDKCVRDIKPPEKTSGSIISKKAVGIELAKEIAYCIEQGAKMLGVNVVIAITNGDGRLILLHAMDDSFIASIQAAQDKAYTSAALKMPTEEALALSRGGSLDGLTNGNGILLLGGGCPLMIENAVAGAIGVSGGTKDQDILLARIGERYFKERV